MNDRKRKLGKCWRSGLEDELTTSDTEANSDATCLGVTCIRSERTEGVPNLL